MASPRSAPAAVDPTKVRLSEHLLLSDMIGCHSSYVFGHANVFEDLTGDKLAEGRYLANEVLEPILADSPLSISYGYISLELARKIVRYQSPDKPSYHQWNDGAACDIVVHSVDLANIAPIYTALACDEAFPMSRTITYSESPYICVATRIREGKTPRKAFYENRYAGVPKAKPMFVTVPENREAFLKQREKWEKRHPDIDWRGAGYPTHHGGGRKQVHHHRVGRYSMLSDFLYSTDALYYGFKNCPTIDEKFLYRVGIGAEVYEKLLTRLKVHRLSIVRAYESPRWSRNPEYHWAEGFAFDVVPPSRVGLDAVADAAMKIRNVDVVFIDNGRVSVRGQFR